MKLFGFILLVFLGSSSMFGQQILWSTIEEDTVSDRYIPLKNVTEEVLKFYDHYEMHFDLAGYSKERFKSEMDYGFNDWEWIDDIKELTVIALRSNIGNGSIVLITCVSQENINLVLFSNSVSDIEKNPILNYDFEREKFEIWFNTLLN